MSHVKTSCGKRIKKVMRSLLGCFYASFNISGGCVQMSIYYIAETAVTECYSISFLFLFFFHQSSLYPIKIFAKCFDLLVIGASAAKPHMDDTSAIFHIYIIYYYRRTSDRSNFAWRRTARRLTAHAHRCVKLKQGQSEE